MAKQIIHELALPLSDDTVRRRLASMKLIFMVVWARRELSIRSRRLTSASASRSLEAIQSVD
jgi:hypothetical protein